MKWISFILFTFLFLVGCRPRNELSQQLFGTKDCAAPCFLGITPGTTSEADAKTIVRTNSLFGKCQDYDYTAQGGVQGVQCKSITMAYDKGFVSQISFFSVNVSLKEVINKFRSPNGLVVIKVNLPEAPNMVKASLFYEDIQTQITLPAVAGDTYVINGNNQIESITYYSQERYEDITEPMLNMELWQGYRSYLGKLP